MELQIGARGSNTAILREALIQNGYYDITTLQSEYEYFDPGLMEAVKRFYDKQYSQSIEMAAIGASLSADLKEIATRASKKDYRVDSVLWKALGLTVNTTLAQEFWSGTEGNSTISVTISGTTITIHYNPKVYIQEEYFERIYVFDPITSKRQLLDSISRTRAVGTTTYNS